MNWLFEQLRPKVDTTSMYDDDIFEGYTPPPRPPLRKAVVLPIVIIVVGLLFIAVAITIGVHVDWVLTDTIMWERRHAIWAWPPMALTTAVGVLIAGFGSRHLWVVCTSYPRRRR